MFFILPHGPGNISEIMERKKRLPFCPPLKRDVCDQTSKDSQSQNPEPSVAGLARPDRKKQHVKKQGNYIYVASERGPSCNYVFTKAHENIVSSITLGRLSFVVWLWGYHRIKV